MSVLLDRKSKLGSRGIEREGVDRNVRTRSSRRGREGLNVSILKILQLRLDNWKVAGKFKVGSLSKNYMRTVD